MAIPVGDTLTKTISVGKDVIGENKTLLLRLVESGNLIVPESLNWTLEGLDYAMFGNWRVVYLTGDNVGITIPAQDSPAAVDDGYYYTIDGLRTRHATRPGLYIKNGKKIVVR